MEKKQKELRREFARKQWEERRKDKSYSKICKKMSDGKGGRHYIISTCLECGKEIKDYRTHKFCSLKCSHKNVEFRETNRQRMLKKPINYWLGKKRPEVKNFKGFDRTGKTPWNKGKKSELTGDKHPNWKGGKTEKICEFCNKGYIPLRRCKTQKFCSDKCRCDWISREGILRGENNAMWKNGSSLISHTWEFKVKISPMLRKNSCCRLCNSSEDLVVHHLNEMKQDNSLENLIVLCRSCHAQIHSMRMLEARR